MPREYRILLGYTIVFTITSYTQSVLIVWLPVFLALTSMYALYRRSTLFGKFRMNDNRYFISSRYDQPFTRKDLYVGIALLSGGLVYYLIQSRFNFHELLDTAIISSFIIFGLAKVLSSLFLVALPVTELLIKDHSIEIIRYGSLLREFYDLTDFAVEDQSIALIAGSKRFELTDLFLSKEQKDSLTKTLDDFRQQQLRSSRIQRDSRKRLKAYFSLKRSKV
ncbi:MAG: hypothetical protein AAFQ94_15205 [Bacteroidota bacterium]